MIEGAIDAIAALEEQARKMQGWCDPNGEYETEIVSVSVETLVRMETVARIAREALESGRAIDWGDGDSASYMVAHRSGETPDEPRLV